MAVEPRLRTIQVDGDVMATGRPEAAAHSPGERRHTRTKSGPTTGHWEVAGMALVAKLLIFVLAAESYLVLANEPIHGFNGWLTTLNRWDTVHYLSIAEHGYGGAGAGRDLLAFFPGYPWAVRATHVLIHDYLISALLVSTVSSVIAALLLYRVAELDFSSPLASRAAWFLMIFPTSYFIHFAYAESLFLTFVLGSILAARKDQWAHSGILGALAGLTRINGLVLIPVLICEAARRYSETRRLDWRGLFAFGPAVGMCIYLLVNLHASGNALTFLMVQREHWSKHLSAPWTGIAGTIASIRWRGAAESQMIGVQELAFIMLGVACTIYCWARLRRAYAIWMTGNLLLSICTSFIYSVPRYTLTMFPIFIVFAIAATNRVLGATITLWSLLFLALFTALFARGQWAF